MEVQLINCPACDNKCSSMASNCPSCGHPFKNNKSLLPTFNGSFFSRIKSKNKLSQKWKILIIFAVVLTAGLSYSLYKEFIINRRISASTTQIVDNNTVEPPSQNLFFDNNVDFSIKAAIIYKMGGVQPVARTTFYLSKIDLEDAAKRAGIQTATTAVSLWAFEENAKGQLGKQGNSRFVEALKPFIVRAVTTDLNGEAKFESVPELTYYIIGLTQTRAGMAVWNLQVNTRNKSIILDQSNAALVD